MTTPTPEPQARYFNSPEKFRAWLHRNHHSATDILVGFHKTHTGTPCMTWPQSVAEALCYGWIDGLRKRLDEDRYTIRFTPRRPGSKWSAVNIRLIAKLDAAGLLTDAGRAAFDARPHKTGPKSEGYKAQKKVATLDAARLRAFKQNKLAWRFFAVQPPGYQKAAAWWIMSAKKEETRDSRLAKLIELSIAEKRMT